MIMNDQSSKIFDRGQVFCTLMLSGFMSLVCTASEEIPWYSCNGMSTGAEAGEVAGAGAQDLDKGVEDLGEVPVAVPVTGIDAAVLEVRVRIGFQENIISFLYPG